jgi:hypothetical protein
MIFPYMSTSGIVLRIAGEEDQHSESQNRGISMRLDPPQIRPARLTRVGFHGPVRKLETLFCQNMKRSAFGFLNKENTSFGFVLFFF